MQNISTAAHRPIKFPILISRLLTRSGDQAWDFAVPLVLLQILPGELRVAATYYLAVRLLLVILLPRVTAMIDRQNRMTSVRIGIGLQFVGVLVGSFSIYFLSGFSQGHRISEHPVAIFVFIALAVGGVLSGLGASFSEILVANDIVPSAFKGEELAALNSRLRQIDLFTEVAVPVVAGILLTLGHPALRVFGFLIVAAWNLLSFVPEYWLLRLTFLRRPELLAPKSTQLDSVKSESLFKKLSVGWRAFFREPIALAMLSYAILWLSVLSPHGVLLSVFLKDGWRLPEWAIGTFRGAGAFFGLLATVLFPIVDRKFGLRRTAHLFIMFQAGTLLVGLFFFFRGSIAGQIGFLVCILLSRIGLYGFSLGELQIRQIGITPSQRGQVNGFAGALAGVATLVLYGAGALMPSTSDFRILIVGSIVSVATACVVYTVWVFTKAKFDERFSLA